MDSRPAADRRPARPRCADRFGFRVRTRSPGEDVRVRRDRQRPGHDRQRESAGSESRAMAVMGFNPFAGPMRFELATPLLLANVLRWMSPDVFRDVDVGAQSAGPVAMVRLTRQIGQRNPSRCLLIPTTGRSLAVQRARPLGAVFRGRFAARASYRGQLRARLLAHVAGALGCEAVAARERQARHPGLERRDPPAISDLWPLSRPAIGGMALLIAEWDRLREAIRPRACASSNLQTESACAHDLRTDLWAAIVPAPFAYPAPGWRGNGGGSCATRISC